MSYNNYSTMQLRKGEKRMTTKFAEYKTNPEKLWYGIIQSSDGTSVVGDYYSKFRHQATNYFEEAAQLLKGTVTHVGFSK
jgi:hypothetical protein